MRQIKDAGQSYDDDQLDWPSMHQKQIQNFTQYYRATESSFTFTDIQNDKDENDGKFLV